MLCYLEEYGVDSWDSPNLERSTRRDSNSSRTPPVLMDLVGAGRDVIARASEVDPQCVCIDL